ncbi:uncharacterized protein TNCV_1423081 [Trichonephila clavipes]|nr:uncharacterized protein TNCV_1423081 [Trichonephila clavipes]
MVGVSSGYHLKNICLQKQNLLLPCNERSGGSVNIYNARIRSLENPHKVLESLRDSTKTNGLSAKGFTIKLSFVWPPRSPNLAPSDSYLWGIVKDCVYVPPLPADLPDLRHMFAAADAKITSDTLKKVWDELAYRLDVWRVMNGAHIEHL